MKGPRALQRGEFEELFALINRAYNDYYNPNWIRKVFEYNKLEDHLVIKEDDKVVSNVSIFPFQVSIRGIRLKVGDIGNVATEEEYRGRGFASSPILRGKDDSRRLRPIDARWIP